MPGRGLEIKVEMKDSHFPCMGLMLSLPDATRELIMSDLLIVPAIITVFEVVLVVSVGPVKFSAGPTVYFLVLDGILELVENRAIH